MLSKEEHAYTHAYTHKHTYTFIYALEHTHTHTGVLSEEELGNKLYVTELGRQEYAAHVRNLRAYDSISRDIIQRWAFPFVPDTHLLWKGGAWGPTTYRYARGNSCVRFSGTNKAILRHNELEKGVAWGPTAYRHARGNRCVRFSGTNELRKGGACDVPVSKE